MGGDNWGESDGLMMMLRRRAGIGGAAGTISGTPGTARRNLRQPPHQ